MTTGSQPAAASRVPQRDFGTTAAAPRIARYANEWVGSASIVAQAYDLSYGNVPRQRCDLYFYGRGHRKPKVVCGDRRLHRNTACHFAADKQWLCRVFRPARLDIAYLHLDLQRLAVCPNGSKSTSVRPEMMCDLGKIVARGKSWQIALLDDNDEVAGFEFESDHNRVSKRRRRIAHTKPIPQSVPRALTYSATSL